MPKILIVDDEPSIVDNITFALQIEGFKVTACSTAGEALKHIESVDFDLMILDVGLPDVNGFELARQIRGFSKIPIIFLTARSSEIDRVVGLELGGDDYVTKPFSPRELSARVKAVLRRAEMNGSLESVSADSSSMMFEIDTEKMQITYCNQRLELSRIEFRLLKRLIQKPGRVFSREQLMNHAWEHAGVSMDRTVDTHIKTIRQKLKAIHSGYDPIVTHRGTGYALRED